MNILKLLNLADSHTEHLPNVQCEVLQS